MSSLTEIIAVVCNSDSLENGDKENAKCIYRYYLNSTFVLQAVDIDNNLG